MSNNINDHAGMATGEQDNHLPDPFVEDLALSLAGTIMRHMPYLQMSNRAPQRKAHMQLAITRIIEQEMALEDQNIPVAALG